MPSDTRTRHSKAWLGPWWAGHPMTLDRLSCQDKYHFTLNVSVVQLTLHKKYSCKNVRHIIVNWQVLVNWAHHTSTSHKMVSHSPNALYQIWYLIKQTMYIYIYSIYNKTRVHGRYIYGQWGLYRIINQFITRGCTKLSTDLFRPKLMKLWPSKGSVFMGLPPSR